MKRPTQPNNQKLIKIRQLLEHPIESFYCPNFPKNGCDIAARAVNVIYRYPLVFGTYTPTNSDHVWNEIPDLHKYLDLSLDQMDGIESKITILPDTTLLLKRDSEKTDYYSDKNNNLKWERILKKAYGIYPEIDL